MSSEPFKYHLTAGALKKHVRIPLYCLVCGEPSTGLLKSSYHWVVTPIKPKKWRSFSLLFQTSLNVTYIHTNPHIHYSSAKLRAMRNFTSPCVISVTRTSNCRPPLLIEPVFQCFSCRTNMHLRYFMLGSHRNQKPGALPAVVLDLQATLYPWLRQCNLHPGNPIEKTRVEIFAADIHKYMNMTCSPDVEVFVNKQ